VKSVIEHALAQETASSIDLVWIAAGATEHYYPKLCRSWAEALDNFSFSPIVTQARPYDALAQALTGLDPLPARDFYVAGGAEAVAATRAFLIESKLHPSQLVTWTPH
jgi:CDP-4-dehydro-6-deoxyglucose reductase